MVSQAVAEVNDGVDDGVVVGADPEFCDEGAIDLDAVYRKTS
jgi:hypothetical protein